MKELEGMLNVSRKTLERLRKYIIALFIIMTGITNTSRIPAK